MLKDIAVGGAFQQFYIGLSDQDRIVLYVLLAAAALIGLFIGRRRTGRKKGNRQVASWRLPRFQNNGEALVSRVLLAHFGAPDYHLMNHVTLGMDDGTTQVDHILVSRFGVFVIETKDYSGWIFGSASDARWIQVHMRRKMRFQNPILQNYRHVLAVRAQLNFIPAEAVHSVVVFSGTAVLRTEVPPGVCSVESLVQFVSEHSKRIMSSDQLQLCVGRLETARLAISGLTDVEHVESLARRFGSNVG